MALLMYVQQLAQARCQHRGQWQTVAGVGDRITTPYVFDAGLLKAGTGIIDEQRVSDQHTDAGGRSTDKLRGRLFQGMAGARDVIDENDVASGKLVFGEA